MRRVVPDGRLVELDASHPIFHSFFEINIARVRAAVRLRLKATFHGMFEDNDPKKRLLLIANYNNDIGEYWEFSDHGLHAGRLIERSVQVRRELRRSMR